MVVHSTIIAMPAASQNSANGQPPDDRRHQSKRHQHDGRQDALFQFGRARQLAAGSRFQRPCSAGPGAEAAEAALAPAIFVDGRPEGGVVEIGPEFRNEDEFRIGRLPGEEVRDPLLTRSADDEVRIRDAVGVEMRARRVRRRCSPDQACRPWPSRQVPAWRRRFPGARHN